jgi:hypothetical protein
MGEGAGDRVLSRLHSVRERIGDSLSAHPNELVAVFTRSALISPASSASLHLFCYGYYLSECDFLRPVPSYYVLLDLA